MSVKSFHERKGVVFGAVIRKLTLEIMFFLDNIPERDINIHGISLLY